MNLALRNISPSQAPSVYFSQAYGEALVLGTGQRWVNLSLKDGSWQMPLVLSSVGGSLVEAASPYGYAGVFTHPTVSADKSRELWEEAIEVLKAANVVSLFLRLSPFGGKQLTFLPDTAMPTVEHISDTISVETIDAATVWASMQGRSRTAVRKAEKSGLVGAIRRVDSRDLETGSDFRRLYESTMERVGAATHHKYPNSYYRRLAEGLGDRLLLATVADGLGQIVAAALVMVDDEVVHYHLSGSDPVQARNGSNNLLVWKILEWAAHNDRRSAHLGGGTGPTDSLFRFKLSFGGRVLPFEVGKFVILPSEYEELVTARAREIGCGVATLKEAGYFPAYRAGSA
ncbi:GNAT family N-acetyltransferase [Salinibacterium sp. UTAS2018]|uniref:GNAT family N-acetyltransferase n=1 Tax=Salinibacterium sp. UTAS2018 TaxID=2508880 RepID=UPI0010095BF0|nr:GNAT family N-acetyltransferase [Salinibacterium sp. UTAS2018]QAV70550.1 GNAT family N-acetyltransferase [Salinibacterium sp. UTAS2018]